MLSRTVADARDTIEYHAEEIGARLDNLTGLLRSAALIISVALVASAVIVARRNISHV